MTPCCKADRWPDIIHPDWVFFFLPVFSSKPTTLHWTDRALLLAICLPCLAPEHVFPVRNLSCWGHHWLLTQTLLSAYQSIDVNRFKIMFASILSSKVNQSWCFRMQRNKTLLPDSVIWHFPPNCFISCSCSKVSGWCKKKKKKKVRKKASESRLSSCWMFVLLMPSCEFLTEPNRNPIFTDHPASKRNYTQFVKWNQNLICLFNDTRLLSTGPTTQPV